jgi:hypothetical protein
LGLLPYGSFVIDARSAETPFSSGGSEREQGIGKDGNRRVRGAMVELA